MHFNNSISLPWKSWFGGVNRILLHWNVARTDCNSNTTYFSFNAHTLGSFLLTSWSTMICQLGVDTSQVSWPRLGPIDSIIHSCCIVQSARVVDLYTEGRRGWSLSTQGPAWQRSADCLGTSHGPWHNMAWPGGADRANRPQRLQPQTSLWPCHKAPQPQRQGWPQLVEQQ